jgi:hypothetical protein
MTDPSISKTKIKVSPVRNTCHPAPDSLPVPRDRQLDT